MSNERHEQTPIRLDWRFFFQFTLYMGLFTAALLKAPPAMIEQIKIQSATAVTVFWQAFSLPFTQGGLLIFFHDFPMEMTLECTAVHYMIIAAAGILACPERSVRQRTVGMVVVTISILLINIARIGILGIVGYHAYRLFEIVHVYLWQGLFALLTLLVWILWMQGAGVFYRVLVRYILVGIVAASASTWLLLRLLPFYAGLLAGAADAFVPILGLFAPMPEAFSADGNLIVYRLRGGGVSNNISVDVLNSVIFWTLLIVTATRQEAMLLLDRVLAGSAVLFLLHLFYVVMYGMLWAWGIAEETLGDIFWITRGFSFVCPLIVWLIVAKGLGRREGRSAAIPR